MMFVDLSINQAPSTAVSGNSRNDDVASLECYRVPESNRVAASIMKEDKSIQAMAPVEEPMDSVKWTPPRRCRKPPAHAVAIFVIAGISAIVALIVLTVRTTTRSKPEQQSSQMAPSVIPPAPTWTTTQPQVATVTTPSPAQPVASPSALHQPTALSAPTVLPAPSPGFAICYICGDSNRQVTNPNATVSFPEKGEVLCSDLELGGLNGFIDPQYCPTLPLFQVPGKCGCTGESAAPVAATPAPSGSKGPTMPPSTHLASLRENAFRSLLANISSEHDMLNESSPQYQALDWIANKDPAKLDLLTTSVETIEKRYIMAAVYFETGGSAWFEQSNFLSIDDICLWHDPTNTTGVVCNPLELHLGNNILAGVIPTELAKLSGLQVLDLFFNNHMAGTIPTELGLLTELTVLNLENNVFSGSIPSEIGNLSQLQSLSLNLNLLTGMWPTELNRLTELTYLGLNNNTLNGTIGTEWGSRSNVQNLLLGSNQFSGTLPSELGSWSKLQMLGLDSNQFTGTLPTELGLLQNIFYLDVSSNSFNGTVPTSIAALPNLTHLYLQGNDFRGNLTPFFCNKTLNTFEADCLEKVHCSCCTACH